MNPKTTRWLGFLLLTVFMTTVPAQQQPAVADNNQDEVINIDLRPGEGPQDVVRILRSDDKFETNDYVTEAFEVFNTPSYELKSFIDVAVGQEKGQVRAVTTKPDDGSAPRYFIVVTTTPDQLESIERKIRTLDVPGLINSQGSSRYALRVRYRLASELAAVLKGTRLTSTAKVYADDLTNTIYFDDSESVVKAVHDYVRFFDVPAPQIEFDVRIIEVREEDTRKLGLDWEAWKRTLGGQITFSGNYFEGGATFGRIDGLLTLDASVLADFLNYAAQQGSARIVKRSRLTASNLKPAVISESRHIPFYDYVARDRSSSVLTESNPRVDSAGEFDPDNPRQLGGTRPLAIVPPNSYRRTDLSDDEEGLQIFIQPVIGLNSVLARVEIDVNTLSGYDQQDRPLISNQRLSNQFTIHNGETLLLGTIEREQVVEARRGIPGLKSVPVLRYLFSVEGYRESRSRLFLIATPKLSNVTYQAMTLAEL